MNLKTRGQYKGQKWAMQGVNANLKDSSKPIYFTINGKDNNYMAEFNYYEALGNIKTIIEEEILGLETEYEKEEREAKEKAQKEKKKSDELLASYKKLDEENPKEELEKALKGIQVAINLSGETEDLIKAKKGVEMALKLI